jgi:hypothetical protein
MSVESVYPPSNDSLPVDRLYQPIALVKNDGLEDAESVTVQYLVEIGNVEIYNESVIVQINSGEEKQVVFDSTLTYTDPALATVTISVATSGDVFLFNDAVGSGFTFYDNASVSETINSGLMVYPNPFNNNIAISSSSKIASIKVYDTQGKLVFANQPNSQKASIALDVNQGSYVIEVETSKGIERKRLVKTR